MNNEIKIIDYNPEFKEHIKRLNIKFLEKYFTVEPSDMKQLSNPEEEIINKGGKIYYAQVNGSIIATATLLMRDKQTYELGKMVVSDEFQGGGIGKKLVNHCVEQAKLMGANNLILYSNTKLQPALKLYKKCGFIEQEMDVTHYQRANIKMSMHF